MRENEWTKKIRWTLNSWIYRKIAEMLSRMTNLAVLDVGCGTGEGLEIIRSKNGRLKLTGLDVSKDAIKEAKKKFKEVRFFVADICKDEIKGKYDVVISIEVLEHIKCPKKAVQIFKRILSPGGLLFISTPNKSIYDICANTPDHICEMEYHEVVNLLKKEFKILEVYGLSFLPWWLNKFLCKLGCNIRKKPLYTRLFLLLAFLCYPVYFLYLLFKRLNPRFAYEIRKKMLRVYKTENEIRYSQFIFLVCIKE